MPTPAPLASWILVLAALTPPAMPALARNQWLLDVAPDISSRGRDSLEEVGTLAPPGPHDAPGCCRRESRIKTIGVSDLSGSPVTVDVGACRQHCHSGKIKKHEFEELLMDHPDADPQELFMMHSRRRSTPACPEDHVCLPRASRVERVFTTEGTVSVTVTEECGCSPKSHTCQRHPRPVTLHKGTPLQTTVDLGDCQGHCSHGQGCRAVKTKSVSIEGPNGAECLTVMEECSCEAPCYRVSLYEQVYNYTTLGDPVVEVVDIGRCVGECDASTVARCVWREDNGSCSMSLTRASECSASHVSEAVVRDGHGATRAIPVIDHCACH